MNTLMPEVRGKSSSSSRHFEEIAISSGLPRLASIAGCRSATDQFDQWDAALARLDHARVRVGGFCPAITTHLGAEIYEAVALALRENVKMEQNRLQPSWSTDRSIPGNYFSGVVFVSGCSYVVQVNRPSLERIGAKDDPELREPVVADTAQPLNIKQMAAVWRSIGQPLSEDDESLSIDPDDYPLF